MLGCGQSQSQSQNKSTSKQTNKEENKQKDLGWGVSKVKEDMKSRKISHKSAVCAVPEICIPITIIITITIRTLFVQSLKLA